MVLKEVSRSRMTLLYNVDGQWEEQDKRLEAVPARLQEFGITMRKE